MNTMYLDLETYNEVPISVGTARYAETVELLLIGYAVDDEPAQVVDYTAPWQSAENFLELLSECDTVIAHNAWFDRTCLNAYYIGIPSIERWQCTMARALAHSLPGGLALLGEILGLEEDQKKAKEGKQLVQLFCKPRPKTSHLRRATAQTHPTQWARFVEYCRQDVEALRELDRKLPRWNWRASDIAEWHLDQAINDRGMAIDLELAQAVVNTVARNKIALTEDVREILGNDISVTQRDELLAILREYGVDLPDLQASTIERRLEDESLPDPVKELLRIRLAVSKTSNRKWNRLLSATNADGRLRGASQFCGASRTGRSAGRIFQPLNLPRPTKALKKEIEPGIEAFKLDVADLIYPDVNKLASVCLRGAIVAAPGKKLIVVDLANIEGRVLAWFAGEEWKLQAFRDFDRGIGHDLYVLGYAQSFNVPPETVVEDEAAGGKMRLIGKVQELALGYQGAVGAFSKMMKAYGLNLEESRIVEIVQRWRRANPKIVDFWRDTNDMFLRGLTMPQNERHTLDDRISYSRKNKWLRIRLPSERHLSYPAARLNDEGKPSYLGVNQYTRKWERLSTYGGKLVENCTQAVARDIFWDGMKRANGAGYKPVLHVYDEIVAEVPDAPEFSAQGLIEIMTAPIAWAPGLPLAANGFETDRYRKD